MIKWFKKNKEEILSVYSIGISALLLVITMFMIMFMVMCNDLVDRIKSQENELYNITQERNYYYNMYDSIIQSHEDCIPKQQYIDDIEYLESVIRELRGQE